MACWVYEGLLMFGVVFISGYLFGALSQTRHALDNRHPLQAFLFVVFGIYFVWFWSKGQTLAMKTWNIRLVDQNNAPISQRQALVRYCLSWIWFVPALALANLVSASGGVTTLILVSWVIVWALLSKLRPDGQFWHDIWAGTRLITSPPLSR